MHLYFIEMVLRRTVSENYVTKKANNATNKSFIFLFEIKQKLSLESFS